MYYKSSFVAFLGRKKGSSAVFRAEAWFENREKKELLN
ncbi:MAG: hypothetical protein ACJARX_001563 [Psychroserpens sp.]